MDETTLRPKPMPGRHPGRSQGPAPGKSRRPHAARRRGGRLTTLWFGLLGAAVLVLTGIGLGTVGATVIGMSKLAEVRSETGKAQPGAAAPGSAAAPGRRPPGHPKRPPRPPAAPPRAAALGIEAVDSPRGRGALLVGVHIPGPGHTAGLVRGDTLLAFGGTRIESAAGLATAVGAARPGKPVTLTVRHTNGARQLLSTRPGIVT
ncbi:PDZ domain-containing protein [Streptomyces sp. NPDC029674]|uniref:PDZ domain-containing protein n=1 Tax=Streptomyces sp. NPDC029674 TaxID=3365297 RepID=UPI00384DF54F